MMTMMTIHDDHTCDGSSLSECQYFDNTPVCRALCPAGLHQQLDRHAAATGPGRPPALLHDLVRKHAHGCAAVGPPACGQLPQQNAKRIHITGLAGAPVEQQLQDETV